MEIEFISTHTHMVAHIQMGVKIHPAATGEYNGDMDDPVELPLLTPAVTYLREITLEGKELHEELLDAGFNDKQATAIVAQFILDAVNSREEGYAIVEIEYSDEDDEDEDDYDDDGDSGI